jgi:hypothetical protein
MSDNIEPGGYILKKAELSNFDGAKFSIRRYD